MNISYIIFFILLAAALLLHIPVKSKSKSFFEKKPESEELDTEVFDEISSDTINKLIIITQKYIKSHMDICAYGIATSYVKQFRRGDFTFYKCSFMFTSIKGFPYGFNIDVDIANDQVIEVNKKYHKIDLSSTENDANVEYLDYKDISPY